MSKILMIGLDGATWGLIKPWVNEGHLSTFKRLMDEGVYGILESTIPPLSIPAWNSLASGKNPGKLGIFSFMSKDSETYQFKPDFLNIHHRYIWDILGDMDKRVVVVNVPCIHRAYKVNGHLVVGFLYTDKMSMTYPEDLKSKLDEVTDGYVVDVLDTDEVFETVEKRFKSIKFLIEKEGRNKYLRRVHAVIEKRFKAIEFLLKEKWDFAFVVFVAPDRVQHRFWCDREVLLDIYKKLDNKLEKLTEIVGDETTVIIVSDHGFGPRKRVFNINEWLLKEGYLRLKSENDPQRMKTRSFLRTIRTVPFAKCLTKFLPPRIRQYFMKTIDYTRVESSMVDWEKTYVFTQPSEENYGDLHFNMREKNVNGITDSVKYKKTADEVVQKLRGLQDPTTGKSVSATVYRRQEIYTGEYVENAPDLIILVDDTIHGFNTTIGHEKIFMLGEGGEHRLQGIFIAHGPHIKKGVKVMGVRIYDIAPTILHILNIPISRDIDGKVLKDIFMDKSEPAKRGVKYTLTEFGIDKGRDKAKFMDEQVIMKRLRKLGYI